MVACLEPLGEGNLRSIPVYPGSNRFGRSELGVRSVNVSREHLLLDVNAESEVRITAVRSKWWYRERLTIR